MGILTPTFHDNPNLKILDAPHEPLIDEPFELTSEQEELGVTGHDLKVKPPVMHDLDSPVCFNNAYVKPEIGAKKVAIIGTAPSSRNLAPFNDQSWAIWPCSPGNMGCLPRFDRWFEIHVTLHWPENQHYGRPYLNWLRTHKTPVMAQKMYANPQGELPNATVFPHEEMVKEFGPYFFTSSFAWMIALAIYEGAEEIALFGVDMASRDEYILQRPGGYYFMTECKRRGIKIGAPYESDILQPPPLYGFCDATPMMRKIIAREKELKERVSAIERDTTAHQQNLTYLKGALEDLDYIKNIWGGAQENHRYG